MAFSPLRPERRSLDYGILTPPDSPRKRRRHLRESDETSGELSIEAYAYRSDPYRSTTITDPLPYPLLARPASQEIIDKVMTHRNTIWEILTQHGFPRNGILTVHDISKPGYPGGEAPVTTFRVLYAFSAAIPRVIGPAKDEIYDFLQANKIYGVEVEIVHLDLCFRPSLFAISPQDPTVTAYEASREKILGLLQEHLRSSWKSLCLFYVGRTREKAQPTIVIMVKPRAFFDWSELESKIRVALGSGHEINVEFLPGELGMLPEQEDNGVSFLDRMAPDGRPEMGCSIGVVGEVGGGTMGGFLTLTLGGFTHRGFMTNYHVIRPCSNANEAIIKKADRFGSSPFATDETHCDVLYLAVKDRQATLQQANETLTETRDQLRNLEQARQSREIAMARIPPGLQMQIDDAKNRIVSYENKQAAVQAMPEVLGKVLVSSGNVLFNNRIVDWAFVELDDQVADAIFQANKMPDIPASKRPNQYGLSGSLMISTGQPLTEFGELVKGEYYFKVGRTTGLTTGICNGVKTHCHWDDDERVRYDERGNQVDMAPDITEEYILVRQSLGQGVLEQDAFCKPGDSGSFIIDRFGRICGLLYGAAKAFNGPPGREEFYFYAGLAMTIPDVLKTISIKTTPRYAHGNPTGDGASIDFPMT
jgi:hypothetical protein